MRPSSTGYAGVIGTSALWEYSADLFYDDVRRFTDLPIDAPQITWDASADIEGSAKVTVRFTDDHGKSIKPNDPQDWLAPFGARLVLFVRVTAGTFSERLQLGEFDITAVPSANDEPFMLGQTRIVVGSTVELVLKDRMVEVQRDRFSTLSSPKSLTSVYDELARLTGFQLTRTLADGPITRAVVYEESRIAAVQDLARIIGGIPFMDWNGTLSLRPAAPGNPVTTLSIGPEGTIRQLGSSLDSEGVYNGVIIRGETLGQTAILAERWVEEGPLRATRPGGPRTPFHRVPRFYSSPFITTLVQAAAAAPALLQQFSQPRAAQLSIQCFIDPRLQAGDVVKIEDGAWDWTIRLTKVEIGGGAYMTLLGDVLTRVLH